MKLTMRELRRLAKDGKVAVFSGAGISFPSPSDLPLAKELVRLAATAVAAGVEERFRGPAAEAATTLRPEVFADALIGLCGPRSASYLATLLHAEPNANHHRLARCLAHGCPMATTNFDLLIEAAAERAGVALSLCLPPAYRPAFGSRGAARLYKLHGTLSASEPEVVTPLAVSFRQTALRRTRNLERVLKRLLESYVVVFVGYSGLDDFDINPILRTLELRSVRSIWVNHVDGRKVPGLDENLGLYPTPRDTPGAAALFVNGIYLDCETSEFLLQLAPGRIPRIRPLLAGAPGKREHIWELWARGLPMPPHSVLGDLALTANQPDLAAALLERSLAQDRLNPTQRARLLLRLAMARRRQGDPLQAQALAEQALTALEGMRNTRLAAEALQAIGSYRRLMSDWRGAARAYLRGVRLVRRHGDRILLAELLNSLAISLDKLGKTRSGVALLARSLALATRAGEVELQSRLHNNLGYMLQNLGRPLEAVDHLRTGLSLKRELGNAFGLGNGLHNVGWVHQINGDYALARSAFIESLKVKKQSGADRHGIAQTRSALAQVCIELGQYGRARKLLFRALTGLSAAGDAFGSAEAAAAMARACGPSEIAEDSAQWLDLASAWLEPLAPTPEVRRLRVQISDSRDR